MEEKVEEILAKQGKQLEVDAIIKAMENNKEIPNKELIQDMKKDLWNKQRDKYLINEEKRMEETKKYTQTCREEIEEKRKQKIEENKRKIRMKKAIETYERHSLDRMLEERQEKPDVKSSFFKSIKQFLDEIFKTQPEIARKEIQPKAHKQFQEELRKKNGEKTSLFKEVENSKIDREDIQR